MCMYLTNGHYLGQRLVGYECFDSKSKGFVGMSEKQIIEKLKRGERVYGFVLGNVDEKETLVLDADGFNMTNLQLKSGVNNLSWLNENSDCDMNVRRHIVGGTNSILFSGLLTPRLRSPVGDRRLSAGQLHIVVALFERQDSCF